LSPFIVAGCGGDFKVRESTVLTGSTGWKIFSADARRASRRRAFL
jgi:hypothetical protein